MNENAHTFTHSLTQLLTHSLTQLLTHSKKKTLGRAKAVLDTAGSGSSGSHHPRQKQRSVCPPSIYKKCNQDKMQPPLKLQQSLSVTNISKYLKLNLK